MNYSVLSKYRTELIGGAMLWVMLYHAIDLDAGHPFLDLVRAAGFGGVDIFILLSSMGLAMSLSRQEQDYSLFMARRASRVLPAYYLVMVPYTLFCIVCQGAPWSALIWNASLLYYWVHPSGMFNWYIAGAMTFYAVTPLSFRALSRSRRRAWLTAAVTLAGVVMSEVLWADGFWQVMDLVYRIPVFFLGLLLGLFVLEDRRLGGKDVLFWTASLALGVVYLVLWSRFQRVVHLPTARLFLFTTVPMCLILCWCFQCLPLGWLERALGLLGKYSLEIYLLNVSVFSQVELLRRFVSFGPDNRMYYLLSFAANIALGILLHKLVEGLRRLWTGQKNRGTA